MEFTESTSHISTIFIISWWTFWGHRIHRHELGDLFISKMRETNITLWQGDCLELMKDIPDESIDMILADLP